MKKQMESWFGPSEDTMKTMLTSGADESGEVYDVSMQELGTMGKIITEGGRKFAKSYNPETGKYRDIKESGWGEAKYEHMTDEARISMMEDKKKSDISAKEFAAENTEPIAEETITKQGHSTHYEGNKPIDVSTTNLPTAGDLDNMSFDQAFAAEAARQGPGKKFMWQGAEYTTDKEDQ